MMLRSTSKNRSKSVENVSAAGGDGAASALINADGRKVTGAVKKTKGVVGDRAVGGDQPKSVATEDPVVG